MFHWIAYKNKLACAETGCIIESINEDLGDGSFNYLIMFHGQWHGLLKYDSKAEREAAWEKLKEQLGEA